MSEQTTPAANVEPVISDEALKKAEEFIEEEEGAANKLSGWLAAFVTFTAVAMSAFHLYTAYGLLATQTLRPVHVAWVLSLSFLVFPVAQRFRHRIMWWDWILALLSVAVAVYLIQGGDDFTDRNTSPENWDIFFGIALILMVMEVMRRTNGWIMPAITTA
ncbi:MAG: C4-dicarboxylate ABC transporter permease, partial [Burkholderiales bacterium]